MRMRGFLPAALFVMLVPKPIRLVVYVLAFAFIVAMFVH
jgi:hypothetical protein